MKYITSEDLAADIYQRFVTESTTDGDNVLDNNESRAISLVKTHIGGRYDTGAIFGLNIGNDAQGNPIVSPPIRDELLVDIISKITLYKTLRRNAARKVPTDCAEDYKWAMEQLEKINAGRIKLKLPPAIEDTTGKPISNGVWGNNSNSNFYI